MSASNIALYWGKMLQKLPNVISFFKGKTEGRTQVFDWFSRFESGRNSVEVVEHLSHAKQMMKMWID
jgi:hypothetical protein